MMTVEVTVEEMHQYLRNTWFGYNCCDKDQLTRIIEDELEQSHGMSRDKLQLYIKRRCQAETGR